MASFLRSFFRGLFAIEALAIPYVLGMDFYLEHGAGGMYVPYAGWAYGIGALAFLLFAAAFWTSRKSRFRRHYLAAAACLLNLTVSIISFHIDNPHTSSFGRHMLPVNASLIALSLTGIVLFLRREKIPAAPPLPAGRLAEIPGDRTWRGTGSVVTLLFVAAAFILERGWSEWASGHGLSHPPLALMLLAIVVALTATAVIHEGGHAIVGAMFGMKLLAITVGPFRLRKTEGRWRFKFKNRIFGGSVSSAPTHPDQPAWQDALMIFAGPLANLVSAPALFAAALQSPATRLAHLWFPLSFAASLSIIVPVLNLIPFRTATGSYSDGARLAQLFTSSPILEYHRALRGLQSTLVTARRPRDLDAAVFQRAAALRPHESAGFHAHLCAAVILEDRQRLAEAAGQIAAAEAIDRACAIRFSPLLCTAIVRFEAIQNRDAVAARLWWDRMSAKKPDRKPVGYWLAAAALAHLEGRATDAESAWREARAAAEKLPDAGAYNSERENVTRVRAFLDQPVQIVPVAEELAGPAAQSLNRPLYAHSPRPGLEI